MKIVSRFSIPSQHTELERLLMLYRSRFFLEYDIQPTQIIISRPLFESKVLDPILQKLLASNKTQTLFSTRPQSPLHYFWFRNPNYKSGNQVDGDTCYFFDDLLPYSHRLYPPHYPTLSQEIAKLTND